MMKPANLLKMNTRESRRKTLTRPVVGVFMALCAVALTAILLTIALKPPSVDPADAIGSKALSAPKVVFVGDSYTGGSNEGGDFYRDPGNWARQLSSRFGWQPINASVGGSGYVHQGVSRGVFQSVSLPIIANERPALVVVQGSINDSSEPAPQIYNAAREMYSSIRSTVPGVGVIVVGPPHPSPGEVPVEFIANRDAVRSAAGSAGLPFIDPIEEQWLVDPRFIGRDNIHPNKDGHAHIATILGDDLLVRRLLPAGSIGVN